jgi:hypothetical protein
MELTAEAVAREHEWVLGRAERIVALINSVREKLGALFETEVATVTTAQYREAVDDVFADGDLAVNVAALVSLLRDLDVESDYPGFVVDELLGRELAGMIAGTQPFRLLGEATFHFADVHVHEGEAAGHDDLDAALAAGFQTRLPGWDWAETDSPFASHTD